MKIFIYSFAIASVLFINLISCSSVSQTPKGSLVSVSTCDTTINIKKNDSVVVWLESQITTGYAWELISQSESLMLGNTTPETIFNKNNDQEVDGGSEKQLFRLTANGKTGTDVLEFHYRRSFAKSKASLKICKITVNVQ